MHALVCCISILTHINIVIFFFFIPSFNHWPFVSRFLHKCGEILPLDIDFQFHTIVFRKDGCYGSSVLKLTKIIFCVCMPELRAGSGECSMYEFENNV